MANITKIPAPRVPIVDLSTGFTTDEWFRFFNNLFTLQYAAFGIVTPGTYGTAARVPQITVDDFGQITNITDVYIQIDASQIVSGTLVTQRGGTGQNTYEDGELLIGTSDGNTLVKNTLGYGIGLLVTNGQGTITLDFSNPNVADWAAVPSSANLAAAMTDETGTGLLVFGTNPTLYSPNIDVIDFDTAYATTLTAGQMGWDGNNTLGLGMIGGNVIQHIGEDQFFYCKATSAITKGQVVMFTGAVGASGVPTGAPATGITDGTYIMGVAAESIALNGFGLVQSFGTLRNVDTSGYVDGDILWYNPSVAGGLTKTKPSAPNVKAQIAAVINGGSSGGGTILIRINPGSTLGGTDSNAQINGSTNGQIITYDGAGAYWKNTSLTAGTAISISAAADGTLTITNTAPSSGGTVTSVSFTGGIISVATPTSTPALTVAGTSGGIPYFSSTSTWASSAALTANALMIGGGAGAAPSTITTGTGVLTALGVNTGSSGAFVVNGGALGTPSSGTVTNLTGTAAINITGTAPAGTLTGTTLNSTVVTSSLTTVGTIGTGVWHGTAIDAVYGGTGQTSYAVGDLLYASTTTALSKLADVATGNALISGGVGVAPSWGKIGLTTHVTGTLPNTNGGTGTSTAFTAGSVVFAGASGVYSQNNANFFWDNTNTRLGILTNSPQFGLDVRSSVYISGGNASGTFPSFASVVTIGGLMTLWNGAPTPAGEVDFISLPGIGGGGGFYFGQSNSAGTAVTGLLRLDAAGKITLATWNATTIGTAYGGTGLTSFTANQVFYASSTSAVGQSANLTFNGTTLTANTLNLTTALGTSYGGTGLSSFTANGIAYASSTSALATGSALTFDGTNFSTTGTATAKSFIPSSSTIPTNGMYLAAANSVGLATNSTLSIYIDSSQRVSVGYGASFNRFQVYGDSAAFSPSADNSTNGIGCCILGTTLSSSTSASAKLYMTGANAAHAGRLILNSGSVVTSQMDLTNTAGTVQATIYGDGNATLVGTYSATVGATNRDLYVDNTGKIGYVSSTRESKTNIVSLNDVSWVTKLNPVSFNRKKKRDIFSEDEFHVKIGEEITDDFYDELEYGLIAEEVETVNEKLCYYDDDIDGNKKLAGVHYSKLIAPMLKYIQDLEARLAILENK